MHCHFSVNIFWAYLIVIMLLKVLSYRAQQDRQLVLAALKDMPGGIGNRMSLLADTDLILVS